MHTVLSPSKSHRVCPVLPLLGRNPTPLFCALFSQIMDPVSGIYSLWIPKIKISNPNHIPITQRPYPSLTSPTIILTLVLEINSVMVNLMNSSKPVLIPLYHCLSVIGPSDIIRPRRSQSAVAYSRRTFP